ncbi:MAG: VOC family protein [Rhodobacteraceae bacterium]|nr:VOC family protein [Paracoccaceae bacterium]
MKLEFHHINFVSNDVSKMHEFYTKVLRLENKTKSTGYSGEIQFATDGSMQMHLAEKNLDVAAKHKMQINPVEKGHIAFRTDNLDEFLKILKEHGIPFSDYGTAFAKEWHQVFFHDPEGNVVEVHQKVD